MQFKAVVNHKRAFAHYLIFPENQHRYKAVLIRYDGKPVNTPESGISITKDTDQLQVGVSEQKLGRELARAVEKKIRLSE